MLTDSFSTYCPLFGLVCPLIVGSTSVRSVPFRLRSDCCCSFNTARFLARRQNSVRISLSSEHSFCVLRTPSPAVSALSVSFHPCRHITSIVCCDTHHMRSLTFSTFSVTADTTAATLFVLCPTAGDCLSVFIAKRGPGPPQTQGLSVCLLAAI